MGLIKIIKKYMKTLKQAREDDLKAYYLCKCAECSEIYVIPHDEFLNKDNFPNMELNEHECIWICPNCEHVNVENSNKDIYKHACYQSGSQNLMFEFTDYETQAARQFMIEHEIKDDDSVYTHIKKQGQFSYNLTPNVFGKFEIIIKDNESGESKNISEIEYEEQTEE